VAAAGTEVVQVGVDANGRLNRDGWEHAVAQPGLLLASAMAVNNETGVRFDLAGLAGTVRRVHGNSAAMHGDLTQAFGRLPVDVRGWKLDLASFSGHKLGAPMGVGVLFVRRGLDLAALIGGHQELGRRGGTENVMGIAALGAVAACLDDLLAANARVRMLRDRLWTGLAERVPDVLRNAPVAVDDETGNTLSVAFQAVSAATLQRALDLDGVHVSTGAACASGTVEPSHVLLAMFGTDAVGTARAKSTLRFSLGPTTTKHDIDRALAVVPAVVARVRRFVAADS
jgi:cysteine desulfurase